MLITLHFDGMKEVGHIGGRHTRNEKYIENFSRKPSREETTCINSALMGVYYFDGLRDVMV
jgi:hypothetical protein